MDNNNQNVLNIICLKRNYEFNGDTVNINPIGLLNYRPLERSSDHSASTTEEEGSISNKMELSFTDCGQTGFNIEADRNILIITDREVFHAQLANLRRIECYAQSMQKASTCLNESYNHQNSHYHERPCGLSKPKKRRKSVSEAARHLRDMSELVEERYESYRNERRRSVIERLRNIIANFLGLFSGG